MVTSDGSWYRQFGAGPACLPDGDFRLDDGPNGARLMSAYQTLLGQIAGS